MKFTKLLAAFCLFFALSTHAEILPAEQMLPDDTVAFVTVGDWTRFATYYNQSPYGKLWNDPAMKKFRENFETKFKSSLAEPLQRELGLKVEEYKDLLQGQITIALTPPREGSTDPLGLLIMLDAKSKSDSLKTRLGDLKKKWSDSGKQTRTEKIRDTEFSVISFTDNEWKTMMDKIFPGFGGEAEEEEEKSDEKSEPTQLHIGQHKSLLLIAENPKVIEKIIAKESGGSVSTLSEQAAFARNYSNKTREALSFAWLNWKPVYEMIAESIAKASEGQDAQAQPGMPNIQFDKILPALGLKSIDSLAFHFTGSADGMGGEFFLAAPESTREGLTKMFALAKKDASPPPFVPADALRFQRWRLDIPAAWGELENIVRKIFPEALGMMTMMLDGVGKEKDPNFDFRKNFIGNMGDDLIAWSKAPKSMKLEDVASPPGVFLLGSPKANELIETIRTLTMLMPSSVADEAPREREFLGKKIYSVTLPTGPAMAEEGEEEEEDSKETPKVEAATLSYAASGGYVAFSADAGQLEEYLRASDGGGKSLRETAGLPEAAQKTGGMENGFFGYENQKETMRATLELIKQAQGGFGSLVLPNAVKLNVDSEGAEDKGWFDYSALPDYGSISKYFGLGVYGGGSTADGFSFRFYGPTPAGLK